VARQVLLADEGGRVLEGLSSNFFAVVGGAVHTAAEGVLPGTVREVALQVAPR
jgi:branched-chain amino acid aminotransferase